MAAAAADDSKTAPVSAQHAPPTARHDPSDLDIMLTGDTSPSVRRMELISSQISRVDRVFLFVSVFLIAYVYTLDGTLRTTYQVGARHTSRHRASNWQA